MSAQQNKLPPIQAPTAQPLYHHANPYESSSTSTISPQSPGSGTASGGLPSAPRSADPIGFGPRRPVQAPGENLPRYGADYEPMLMSPAFDQFRAGPRMDHMMGGSPHGPQGVPGAHLQQKRAYRQRRKDPSCDACRERKVKCDATDTSSCSECSSRNVKCQFTKETNRRMSSIKQVQDLEKQLFNAKQQVTQYESMLKSEGLLNQDGIAIDDEDSRSGDASPSKRRKLRSSNEASSMMPSIDKRMVSLMKAYSLDGACDEPESPKVSAAPSLEKAEDLLDAFSKSSLSEPRFVDGPNVRQTLQEVKESSDQSQISKERLTTLYACLACGALASGDLELGQQYFNVGGKLIRGWQRFTVEAIRASLLNSIYLIEANMRSKAFELLGLTIGKALDIGLHHRMPFLSPQLEEERRDLWTAIVCWERTISLEYGRSTMIQDNDLGATIVSEGWSTPETPDKSIGMRRVAKMTFLVQSAFKMPFLTHDSLAQFEDGLLRLLPQPVASADGALFPWSDLHILSARFIIHRHNISPFVPESVREAAFEMCVGIAEETIKLLEQTEEKLASRTPPLSLADAISSGPTTKAILHLWRCAALSLFAGEIPIAQVCTQYLSRISALRRAGYFCGYHLEYFLDIWRQHVPKGLAAIKKNVELITYASADMQYNHDQAWLGNLGDDASAAPPAINGVTIEDYARGPFERWQGVVDGLSQTASEARQMRLAEEAKHAAPPLVEAAAAPPPPPPPPEEVRPDSASAGATSRMKITDLMI